MRDEICDLYSIDYPNLSFLIAREGYKRVLIQAPDGLKPLYPCISRFLERELHGKIEIYLSASPTYGGCDVAFDEALKTSSDAIIHVGHTKYPWLMEYPVPVVYIPAFYKWFPNTSDIDRITAALKEIGVKHVGVLASIQHVRSLSKVEEKLRIKGFETIIPREEGFLDGQVIGCYYKHAERISSTVDAYLVISGGLFHPLGLALIVDKTVIGYDPIKNVVWNATNHAKRILAKRYYILSMIKHSSIKEICVIIGSKPGQLRLDLAKNIVEEALDKGFKTHVIISDRLDFDRIVAIDNAVKPDFFIVTSCPRIPIDDLIDFYKPVLTPGEFHMLIHGYERYVYPW